MAPFSRISAYNLLARRGLKMGHGSLAKSELDGRDLQVCLARLLSLSLDMILDEVAGSLWQYIEEDRSGLGLNITLPEGSGSSRVRGRS